MLIGPPSDKAAYLECDINYLRKFEDKYSQRILALWTEPDDVSILFSFRNIM